MPGDVTLTERQIRAEIFRQYEADLPRIGNELDEFVDRQCKYFGIEERLCRQVIANARISHDVKARSAQLTDAQATARVLKITHVDVILKAKELMEAKRRKAALDGNGNAIKDANGNPVWEEVPDLRVQLAANKQMAGFLGTDAPKQVQVEATHEHHVNITDDELRGQLAELAPFLGLQIVDAQYSVVSGGAEPGAPGVDGDAAESR